MHPSVPANYICIFQKIVENFLGKSSARGHLLQILKRKIDFFLRVHLDSSQKMVLNQKKCYVCKEGIGKFSFPTDEIKLQMWIASLNIERPNTVGANGPRICILHFHEDDYIFGNKRTKLKDHVVPFSVPPQSSSNARRRNQEPQNIDVSEEKVTPRSTVPAGCILQHLASCSDSATDVVLQCGDGAVGGHRLVLAAISPMLHAVFREDSWDEDILILLPDISVGQMEKYFSDIYTSPHLEDHHELNLMLGHSQVVTRTCKNKMSQLAETKFEDDHQEADFDMIMKFDQELEEDVDVEVSSNQNPSYAELYANNETSVKSECEEVDENAIHTEEEGKQSRKLMYKLVRIQPIHWNEIVEMLKKNPNLTGKIAINYLIAKYPDLYSKRQYHNLRHRIRKWRCLNVSEKGKIEKTEIEHDEAENLEGVPIEKKEYSSSCYGLQADHWNEIVVMLERDPYLKGRTALNYLIAKYPGMYSEQQYRNLRWRMEEWRCLNVSDKGKFEKVEAVDTNTDAEYLTGCHIKKRYRFYALAPLRGDEKYICPNCGGGSKVLDKQFSAHIDTCKGCKLCDFKTNVRIDFINHVKTAHGGKQFQCSECSMQFTNDGNLRRHISGMHEEKQIKCFLCDYKTNVKHLLDEHFQVVHEGIPFQCPQCDFQAKWKSALSHHVTNVHKKDKEHLCPHCGHIASNKGNLKLHIKKKHEGFVYPSENLQCPHCEFKGNKLRMKRHLINVHDDGEKEVCSQCGFATATRIGLKNHIRDKHEEPRHFCTQCDYKCTREHYLKQHIKTVHEGLTYPCPHCDFKSKYEASVSAHIKTVHEGLKFKCPYCEHTVTRKDYLHKHIQSSHAHMLL